MEVGVAGGRAAALMWGGGQEGCGWRNWPWNQQENEFGSGRMSGAIL